MVIAVLLIRKLQHKHTIRKLSSWLEVCEWTRLQFEVKCKMSILLNRQLKVPCATFPVDPSLGFFDFILLLYSWSFLRCISFKFDVSWSIAENRRVKVLLFHRGDSLHYQRRPASPRSSRPKSTGFLAFVGPWPSASSKSYRALHFTRIYIATREKNLQTKQKKSTTLTDQTKKILENWELNETYL